MKNASDRLLEAIDKIDELAEVLEEHDEASGILEDIRELVCDAQMDVEAMIDGILNLYDYA